MKKILVTGCAGFIGAHLCKQILETEEDMMENLLSLGGDKKNV